MALIDDLLELGLPFELVGGIPRPTAELNNRQKLIYRTLLLKYGPKENRIQAFSARPDLAHLYGEITSEVDASPDKKDLAARYETALARLIAIRDSPDLPANPTNAQVIAFLRATVTAVKDIAGLLVVILRFVRKRLIR